MFYQRILALIRQYHRIIKYIIAGGTAAAVNIAGIYILTDLFHLWYLASGVLAFLVAFVVSFTLQKFWTFNDHSTENVHIQVSIYLIVSLISLLWNTFLLYIFVDVFHIWYLLAQIFAGAIVALSNYFMYKKFVFKNSL